MNLVGRARCVCGSDHWVYGVVLIWWWMMTCRLVVWVGQAAKGGFMTHNLHRVWVNQPRAYS